MKRGIRNQQTGPGLQNNNNAGGTQSVSFVNSFNTTADLPLGLKRLQDAIAGVGASYDAEQQYLRGDCLPGTREEVLRIIWEWILSQGKELPICWLSGTAGVGKTAIAMTVAKACQKEGRLVSSFFFFRSDPKRNNPSALVLTIAHGLVVTNLSCRVSINQRISDDPTILEARIEEQFRKLVVEPYGRQTLPPAQESSLRQNSSLRETRSKRIRKPVEKRALAEREGPDQQGSTKQTEVPNLVIIDGLDECGDEQTQQRVLSMIQSTFHSSSHSSLRFLICSRPEAWLQEAFADASLSNLSKIILLNDQFRPAKDIMKYYRHQFQKVVSNPRYKQVRFPVPWPSVKDLETLVDKSCRQFVYAATVSRFIAHGDEHPMDQLRLILKSAPNSHPGASPYEALDTLYSIILTANRSPDKVHPILAAIVVLTQFEEEKEEGFLKPTPACIELLLGLPSGEVALRLWGMHSVLYIGDQDNVITIHHTSFRDYLLDRTRSHHFHIDIDTQRYDIVRQWLQNLTTSKILSYSPSQLYSNGTKAFFTSWRWLCILIPKPTRDLLDDLWNVDLAFTIQRMKYVRWDCAFKELLPWVRKYVRWPGICENKDKKEAVGNYSKAGKNTLLTANSHSSCDSGQCEAEAHNPKMAEEAEGRDLVQRLVHKFENPPGCFHLVYPPGATLQKNVVNYIVSLAAGGSQLVEQVELEPTDVDNVCLTDCRCDLSGGSESSDPGHLAYQEACRQLVKAYVSLFEELVQSGAEDYDTIEHLGTCFENMVTSSLLEHCCLDQELLLLCRTFFGLAKGCLKMQIHPEDGEKGRKNMLGWIETFPGRFAEEGKALKAQVRTLPWKQWVRNLLRDPGDLSWASDDSDDSHEL
ncbi:hypothetical protein PQX77_001555 [Marasmius sp. AFHP31]|nr:hypothetical protein PQX77_001555 [Marasmius sp. AFHP31]